MLQDRTYKFFWKSPLSNWYKSKFKVDDVEFNCGEQYMMYAKAMLFNDTETARLILDEIDPAKHKALGRLVKNFNPKTWDSCKYELVKKGLYQKYTQDPFLKSMLLSNKGRIFVEASPYDRIWGIGYDVENAIENINDWGENLLGKILTELSEEIQ